MSKVQERTVIVDEAKQAFNSIKETDIESFVTSIQKAKKIFIYGLGRERLMLQAFAMRLMHLGLNVHVVGDVTTPKIDRGDLFITSSGTGYLSTVDALLPIAVKSGADVVYMTANPESELSHYATHTILIEAQTMKVNVEERSSLQPMGAVFEQAQLFLYEWLIILLKDRGSITDEQMEGYHTNLE
ncbi:6-phospho-3-hexuloisomerase [Thalassobacillus sp. B23F22_16]|uniref:6-phospho-3-hexuloisomerase n=1 Tax=Thalassobacillus sp. B23F22_16 TaxID=3459513 RepID=UPI00373F4270